MLPHNLKIPKNMCKQVALDCIKYLIELMKSKGLLSPFERQRDSALEALDKLSNISKKVNLQSSHKSDRKEKPKIIHPQLIMASSKKNTIRHTTKTASNLRKKHRCQK